MKAIETRWNGYRFRSRLEARWAVFFDALDIKWQYEPEAYSLDSGAYLPDFFMAMNPDEYDAKQWPGAGQWIEIKGQPPSEDELSKLEQLAKLTKHTAHLFVGPPGFDLNPYSANWRCSGTSRTFRYRSPLETDALLLTIHFNRFTPAGFDVERVERALHKSRAMRFEPRACA